MAFQKKPSVSVIAVFLLDDEKSFTAHFSRGIKEKEKEGKIMDNQKKKGEKIKLEFGKKSLPLCRMVLLNPLRLSATYMYMEHF